MLIYQYIHYETNVLYVYKFDCVNAGMTVYI